MHLLVTLGNAVAMRLSTCRESRVPHGSHVIPSGHLSLLLLISLLLKEFYLLIVFGLIHIATSSIIRRLLFTLRLLSQVVDLAIALDIKRLFGLLLHLNHGCVLCDTLSHHELLGLILCQICGLRNLAHTEATSVWPLHHSLVLLCALSTQEIDTSG